MLTTIIDEGDVLFGEKFPEKCKVCKLEGVNTLGEYFCSYEKSTHIWERPEAIKSHIHSRELALLKGVWQEVEEMKGKCPEGFEQCFEKHAEHKAALSSLQAKIQEAIIHLEKKV